MKEKLDIYTVITRKLTGASSKDEESYLKKQLSENPQLKVHFNILKNLWQKSHTDQESKSEQHIHANVMRQVLSTPQRQNRWYQLAIGIASILIIALSITWFLNQFTTHKNTEFAYYQTGTGELKEIILPDGSQVNLNAQTALIVPEQFTGNTREVVLIGEGYFKITKDKNKPFRVKTSHLNVDVLGTEFNLKAYDTDLNIVTYLNEGKVKLSGKFSNTKEVQLIPGEQATLNKQNMKIQVVNTPNKASTWLDGHMRFTNQPLSEIVPVLERKFGIQIMILNDAVKSYKYTGDFKDESLLQILSYLQVTHTFEYETKNEMVIIN